MWYQQFPDDLEITQLHLTNIDPTRASQVSRYTRLTDIYISRSQLSEICPEICKLDLIKLQLHNNNISSLPKALFELRNLTLLNLSWCNLEQLPREICNLINLEDLRLYSNQLTSLPNLDALKRLVWLDVGFNRIEKLDLSQNFEQLDFSHNCINKWPRVQASVLICWGNSITRIPVLSAIYIECESGLSAKNFAIPFRVLKARSAPIESINSTAFFDKIKTLL